MKIDVDEKVLAAQILRSRLSINQEKTKTPKELEIDRLFFWILGRIHYEIGKSDSEYYRVIIKVIGSSRDDETIILQHVDETKDDLNMEKYFSKYVKGREFYDIMLEVAEIFNELDNYYSGFFPKKEKAAEIIVDIY